VVNVLIVEKPFLLRDDYTVFLLLFYGLCLIAYYMVYKYVRSSRSKGRYVKSTLIVGSDDTAKSLAAILSNNKILGYHFLGHVSKEAESGTLGKIEELEELIEKLKIQVFFVTFSVFKEQPHLKKMLQLSIKKGIRIKLVPQKEALFNFKTENSVGGITVIDPFDFPMDKIRNRIQKRIADVLFSSAVILLILSWLLPILALLIIIDSRGPVFFVQKRTGMSNKTFNCFKLRTMKQNKASEAKQVVNEDLRITKIGKFLRKYNLDELPQFICVLLGQMSVVGPRPHMLFHTDLYSKEILHYKSRHFIKPGITGWAQVNGFRGETEQLWKMEKRVEYDMDYIENWSLIKDIKSVFATLFSEKSFQNAR
jgi:putative colanic acid biosynthesis UDP-glucose lipid carrier transferase